MNARGHFVPSTVLGRGCMGTVFLAKRADRQYEGRVAVKILNHSLDSEDFRRRFRQERQILARLEHPNIARLLDAGTADGGLPYFVMERVRGDLRPEPAFESIDQTPALSGPQVPRRRLAGA